MDYFDGAVGPAGPAGKDGYTPVKGVDYFDGAVGPAGPAGKDGYTPVKGVDYFDGAVGPAGPAGKDGQRGTRYWFVQTAPRVNAITVNGVKPPYNQSLERIQAESGASDIIVGDMIVDQESYAYPVQIVSDDMGFVYMAERHSLKGESITITSVVESTEDGGENVVTFSDGTTLTVRNGSKGSPGEGGSGEGGVRPEYWPYIKSKDTSTTISGTYPVSNTVDEIYAAYSAGQSVVLRDFSDKSQYTNNRFYALRISSSECIFYRDEVESGKPTIRKQWKMSSSLYKGERAEYSEIAHIAPNPNALTINGKSYDGSKAVEINVEGGGGSVDAADDSEVLQALVDLDMLTAVGAADYVLTDENNNILEW